MKHLSVLAIVIACIFAVSGGAQAAGNVKAGKKVFKKCKACHSLKAGKKKVGPSLYGLMGAKAGAVSKFRYSKGMKKANIIWNEETLDKYLKKPRKFVKGTKMSFPGLKKKKDRDNVIAYLKEATAKK